MLPDGAFRMQLTQLQNEMKKPIDEIIDHVIENHEHEELDLRLDYSGLKGQYCVDCGCGKIWQIGNHDIMLEVNRTDRYALESFFRDQSALKKMIKSRKKLKKQEEVVKRANGTISSLEV
jgi:hypothetical protein